MKQTILVIGATGAQGGSVARALLQDNRYQVRVLTRQPSSEKAQQLAQAGAEIAAGDLADVASLKTALQGCYGVFGVTNFWEHFAGEFAHGTNLINAVAASEVKHFVFSSLPSANLISGGTLPVPHMDIKAELEMYSKSLGLPATYVHVAFYYENFLSFFPPHPTGDGSFQFGFPQGNTPLAALSVEDCGGVIASIFNNPAVYLGQTVGIVGDDLTCSAYAAIMTEVFGQQVNYQDIPREVFASFGFPGAEELANMFAFNRQYIPERQQDLTLSKRLNPGMKSFETWLRLNKSLFQPILQPEFNLA